MILTQRERYIALAAGGALALLVVNYFFLSPLSARSERVDEQITKATLDMQHADAVFANGRRMNRQWSEMLDAGLTSDASAAESQALHAVRDWAQRAEIGSPSSLKPERRETRGRFQQITLRATGTGSMESVGELLHAIETADIPIRVTDLQITSRKEGTDELSLQLGVSTICLAPDPPKTAPGRGGLPPRPPAGRPAAPAAREGSR